MSEQSILIFVVSELKRRTGSWPEIASATQVPYFTIAKIASGKTKDPGVTKVETLANYFKENPRDTEAA